jgi:hypothetical protein
MGAQWKRLLIGAAIVEGIVIALFVWKALG